MQLCPYSSCHTKHHFGNTQPRTYPAKTSISHFALKCEYEPHHLRLAILSTISESWPKTSVTFAYLHSFVQFLSSDIILWVYYSVDFKCQHFHVNCLFKLQIVSRIKKGNITLIPHYAHSIKQLADCFWEIVMTFHTNFVRIKTHFQHVNQHKHKFLMWKIMVLSRMSFTQKE